MSHTVPERAIATVQAKICELLLSVGTDTGTLPPTILSNEGWMLRLVIDWFSRAGVIDHPLAFAPGAQWYSEVLLSSQFRARHRGDVLAEAWTHADAVIGHFHVRRGRGDAELDAGALQFVVVEAKMFSGLSARTKRAEAYDQAARTIACIAEALANEGRGATDVEQLKFVLVAPGEQIARRTFVELCDKKSIAEKVRLRIAAYGGEKDAWLEKIFQPVLERIEINVASWESIVDRITTNDLAYGAELRAFLNDCLEFNHPAHRSAKVADLLAIPR